MRHLEARLKLVISSLSATIYFNPTSIVLFCWALWAGRAVFGTVPFANMIVAILLQCAPAAMAWFLQRRYRSLEGCDLKAVLRELMLQQAFVGLSWGAAAWLLWCNGNAANNMFIATLMMCIVWAAAFTRSACQEIFFTGVTAVSLMCALRFASDKSESSRALLVLLPVWTTYIVLMGLAAKRRVDDLIAARFANEDLGDELRLARDDALKKKREAETANASKTVFLANMSHELRTPLNAILGFSDIIASQSFGPGHPNYQEYARDIHSSGAHLLELINDILDVAKIEAGKMEIDPRPLDPAQMLAGIERLTAFRAREKQQNLLFLIEPDAPWPVADERAFKQIVLNLVSNALKFTQKGGHVRVGCRRGEGGGFLLAVEDDGPGISADKLEAVFQAFSRVDNRYDRDAGGTGLGLALVRGLAQLHGGNVWIESDTGQGTRVFVYFPLGMSAPAATSRAFG